jgi:hypothetical protein
MPSLPSYVQQAPFNFAPEIWNAAKDEIRSILIDRAKRQDPIAYSDLVARVNSIHFNAYDQRLFAMLGEVSIVENDAGRPLLSVIVVHKTGDMRPGPGFFDLAKSLGRDTSNIEKIWTDELRNVFEHWA